MTEDPREAAIAKAIRGAVCLTQTYPPHVWRTGEAEANIQEWCKWAARAVLAAIDAEEDKPEKHHGEATSIPIEAWRAFNRDNLVLAGMSEDAFSSEIGENGEFI